MTLDTALIRRSWSLVEPRADKVAADFYGLLFSRHPDIRSMFPAAMDHQRDRLLHALTRVVLNLTEIDGLTGYLAQLARDHRKYGVRPEHYPLLGACLVKAMRVNAGGDWPAGADEAWTDAYDLIATTMIEASEADSRTAPPYWNAEVVGHELRSHDLAVVIVRPQQSYPFQAGQYATLQTPQWPKVWRSYSIANPPREDNLLSFHVRVVPGGWVSTALAHRTRVGDTLLLGPPRGSMVLGRSDSPHLVFVAGGTGLAPLKAIIEETAWMHDRPSVDLFHGVRRRDQAYDLPDLLRLREQHGRMRFVLAVSDDPAHPPRESVAETVTRHRVSADSEIFICGSPGMVQASTARLLRMGVPGHKVHTEAVDENGLALPWAAPSVGR
ncbi:globin domain-containing protein [Spongiactinospora sp. TRM90649]|uniref:globin domain-containing protein n=1 Tax=Spongiactinospora sp. TRM90649 TaxID=3031114 RepID=UPI0023F96837|nr:globin domain-containing protein [Spongiactinospora sp. TRM90649]MDF5752024.1 globin domain-containing protein [Spongiactinospora sp. TRM90649]